MRTTAVGLVALPVALGGIGIAVAGMVYSGPTSPGASRSPSQTQEISSTTSAGNSGTSIDGKRPHLTVIDGTMLPLPGSLAGIISYLPAASPPLPPSAPELGTTAPSTPSAAPTTAPTSDTTRDARTEAVSSPR